jgi:soluble lytic murein transglycosylase-like protein
MNCWRKILEILLLFELTKYLGPDFPMNKHFTILFLILICATAASAQSRSLDNFDFATGVKIYSAPDPTPAPIEKKKGRKLLERTAYTAPPNLAMSDGTSLEGYTTGNPKVDSFIVDSGVRNRVDPVLIYATMHQESTFNSRAVSPKGASGLMQLMPGTAARFGVTNMFDQKQNIEGGVRYLRYLLNMFNGDVRLALAGYNAGEGAVMRFGYQVPPFNETQEYVRRITSRYAVMRDPSIAQHARKVGTLEVAEVERPSAPLNTYERSISAVRLPDGRLILVSQ